MGIGGDGEGSRRYNGCTHSSTLHKRIVGLLPSSSKRVVFLAAERVQQLICLVGKSLAASLSVIDG